LGEQIIQFCRAVAIPPGAFCVAGYPTVPIVLLYYADFMKIIYKYSNIIVT